MAGRRTTRTKEERIAQLQKDCNRSGFNGFEIIQIMCDWYGWNSVDCKGPSTHTHTITNSQLAEESPLERDRR